MIKRVGYIAVPVIALLAVSHGVSAYHAQLSDQFSCVTVDCAAPPSGCRYVDPKFSEAGCQVSCGVLQCKTDQVCTDSDGGDEPYTFGVVKAALRSTMTGEYEIVEAKDFCVNSEVGENFCVPDGQGGNNWSSSVRYCPFGCKNGACISAEDHVTTCGDNLCDDGEPDEYYPDGRFLPGSCPKDCNQDDSYDCPAIDYTCEPPQGCYYDGPEYDRGCQVGCGELICESQHFQQTYCSETDDCPGDQICSSEFGYCGDICSNDGICPAMCKWVCMPRVFAYPDVYQDCTNSWQCNEDEVCTAEYGEDCFEGCPVVENNICSAVCNGKCVPGPNAADRQYDGYTESTSSSSSFYYSPPPPTYQFYSRPLSSFSSRRSLEFEDEVRTVNTKSRFSDIGTDNEEGRAANALANAGVIGGFPDGTFRGGASVNRAEAAKFLLLARFGGVPELQNDGVFWDVLEGEWYVKYVVAAARMGIISGYDDRSFRPANTVNTAEFLKMLSRTFDIPLGLGYSYSDVPADAWFAQYAGAAEHFELLPGRPNGLLQPERLLTRGEVAIAIQRYLSAAGQ